MVKLVGPAWIAFCMSAGVILGDFASDIAPASYLSRPLAAAAALALVVGGLAAFAGNYGSLVALVVSAWLVRPGSLAALLTLGIGSILVFEEVRGRRVELSSTTLVVAASVFFLAGALQSVFVAWEPATDDVAGTHAQLDGPVFLILLDGYPRFDTLRSLGIDIDWFEDELIQRGFDIYPNATSRYEATHHTLSLMLGAGSPQPGLDDIATQRAERASWRLPDGFVAIAPPFGEVTIPNADVINPGGFTEFEAEMLRSSLFRHVSQSYALNGFRYQVNRSFEVLEQTNEIRVFAHVLAPHLPFLYESSMPTNPPACYPECSLLDGDRSRTRLTRRAWIEGTAGYLAWLNPRLIEAVDVIISRAPDAQIVIFSDHGGRIDSYSDEWHRTFLAGRTEVPQLFGQSPHPRSILKLLAQSAAND